MNDIEDQYELVREEDYSTLEWRREDGVLWSKKKKELKEESEEKIQEKFNEIFSPEFREIKDKMEILFDLYKEAVRSQENPFNKIIYSSFHPMYPGVEGYIFVRGWRDNEKHKLFAGEYLPKGEVPYYKYVTYTDTLRREDRPRSAVDDAVFDNDYSNLQYSLKLNRKLDEKEIEDIRREAYDYKTKIYKIHLQPKPQYQLKVLNVILSLILNDDMFANYVNYVKAVIPYSRVVDQDQLIPAIVLYIYPSLIAEESTHYVLDLILDSLRDYDHNKIGLGIRPRFNYEISPLIYYTNGDGDDKLIAIEAGIADDYFEPRPSDSKVTLLDGYFFYKKIKREIFYN